MSDFDTVLERLCADPAFAAALAADPARALAGYRLTADEATLLRSQVTADTGGQSTVETRANQSSVFGLLTPLAGLAGAAEVFGQANAVQQGLGPAGSQQQGLGAPAYEHGFGAPTAGQGAGAGAGLGAPAAAQGFGPVAGAQGFGPVAPAVGEGFGPVAPAAQEGFGRGGHGTWDAAQAPTGRGVWDGGDAPTGRGAWDTVEPPTGRGAWDSSYQEGLYPSADPPAGAGIVGGQVGDRIGGAVAGPPGPDPDLAPPEDYRTRVDVDGDGSWDRHRLRGTTGGGVDILVDANGDGRVDFIGHDTDADGLVDSAEYDKNHDGFFERRSYDDDGDGWLDRHETRRPPADPAGGGMIGDNLRVPDQS